MSFFTSKELSTGWEFKRTDDEDILGSWLPVAKVPTCVHIDLMENYKIPDTSRDMNEHEASWVGEQRWSYRCKFSAPPNREGIRIALVFEGLDTFAKVQLNGIDILESDNMFIKYHIDVTAQVNLDSPNRLQIDFDSAMSRACDIRKAHPEHNYNCRQGGIERIGVRKAQYHWGWDWGPKYMTAGPWRPVRLETYCSRIEDLSIEYTLDETRDSCQGIISARIDGHGKHQVRLSLHDSNGELVFQTEGDAAADGLVQTSFSLQNPSLWYPHGYGSQPRYCLHCELIVDGNTVQSLTKRIAFRRAELIQEVDIHGKSFYFRINGIDVFAGGSCWIPADNFIPRLSPERYREWMKLMVESNQILTRIWGGGIYEEDAFYDACDELGILVWQDFLFACGSYPAFPSFLESVEAEARCNVRRLRHHPSLIMFAGGNENYYIQEICGLTYDYDGDKDPQSWLKSTFPSRFIYEYLLPKVIQEESPSLIYHPDSPWGDGKRILDPSVGDIHQWEVWHGIMRPYQSYGGIGGRFNSEFGMEACPHLSTINQFIGNPKEQYPQSLTMDFHNKAAQHERRLVSYVMENFRVTNLTLENWIHLTQLTQSEAMSYAYRSWRRQWGNASARQCGGALVWQLNDCWPAISWAVVDHFLVKKPAFYAIKRALSPISVAVLRTHKDWTEGHTNLAKSCEYDLWIASSQTTGIREAVVEIRFISIRTGNDFFPLQRHKVSVRPNSTTVVCEGIKIVNPSSSDAFVILAKLLMDGQVVSRDVDWPQPFKYLDLGKDSGLKVRVAEHRQKIEISSLKPTKGLTFNERPGLHFSDNGFDVVPGEEYIVDVKGLNVDEMLEWTFLGANASQSTAGKLRAQL